MNLELVLFNIDPHFIRNAVDAGIDAILVDWESRGKSERQAHADTEVNNHTLRDLQIARKCCLKKLICRINAFSKTSKDEIEAAIASGADEILLPMVEKPQDVEQVLSITQKRAGVGILIETLGALKEAKHLGDLPLSRVFIGLNDLAIARKTSNIFLPLIDGTIESIRPYFRAPFGFGGITLPGKGSPIPCILLIEEMFRLQCSFSFLRRSFIKDIQGRDLTIEIPKLKNWIQEIARNRCSDRNQLIRIISSL